jgi:BON domain-containing protein
MRLIVLLVAAALAVGGCGALTGRPVETWAQDRGLTARVKARLAAMEPRTLTRIHVDTYQNVVYLTGGVTSLDMKRRAEAIARDVTGVEQVVNNVYVAGEGALVEAASDVSASPATEGARRVSTPPGSSVHPFSRRFKGVANVDLETGTPGWTRYVAYDARGRRVATIYSLTPGELTKTGAANELTAEGSIDHVSIYRQQVPGAVQYDLVLWHVSREDAARLE